MASSNGCHARNAVGAGGRPAGLDVVIVGAGIGGLAAALFLRQQGHRVVVLEQSRFANETGAAMHLAPNSNGLLRRLGIYAEKFNANLMESITEYDTKNNLIRHIELAEPNKQWQYPWHLVHRVHLHEELKRRAISTVGHGVPVDLRLQSRVAHVDPSSSTALLESGESVRGDVLIGADGVHSKTRIAVSGEDIKPRSSKKSAFRFLVSRQKVLEDPKTARFAERDGELISWYGVDRRVVMYPCDTNKKMNFVCIHPSDESGTNNNVADWHSAANKDKLLAIYADFDESLLALLDKADAGSLRVWELLDMDPLASWVRDRLVLLGDAAHPFLPYQGQGAACAIEDAAALGVVLQNGVEVDEVPERLRLYEHIRQERANRMQEYSRIAGHDLGEKKLDMMEFASYSMGHDEWDNAINIFRRWSWARKPDLCWKSPISFGPMPESRQTFGDTARKTDRSTFTTTSIKFKTSRTLLQNLFPSASFRFKSPGTVAHASFSQTTLNKTEWLGGSGYRHMGLYIHGVQYIQKDGEVLDGTYLPVLFETLADPVAIGRRESDMPKLLCSLDIWRRETSIQIEAGWQGAIFGHIALEGLQEVTLSSEKESMGGEGDEGIFSYKYIPKAGDRGEADVEYATFISHTKEARTSQCKVQRVYKARKGSVSFDPLDWEALPTLHHIISRLAEIPIYEVINAKIIEGVGVPDTPAARRLD